MSNFRIFSGEGSGEEACPSPDDGNKVKYQGNAV